MFGMSGFKEVDAANLHQMRSANEIELIDVRTEVEFAQGTIQGAKHLPLHMLPLVADQIDSAKPVVFICRSGARSAQACAFLASKGHDNVFNLRGGIMGWAQAGLALAAA
jgi:rhodanese-related sulfurtransferase